MNDNPTLNEELLDRTLSHVLANPAQHDQGWYRDVQDCQTVMCFAGWTIELSRQNNWIHPAAHMDADHLTPLPDDDPDHIREDSTDGHQYVRASTRARRLLGLTKAEATALFMYADTLEDVVDTVERIKSGEYRR